MKTQADKTAIDKIIESIEQDIKTIDSNCALDYNERFQWLKKGIKIGLCSCLRYARKLKKQEEI